VGLDIHESRSFNMKNIETEIVYFDGKIFPFESCSFEAALCIEVLEHVAEPDSFVAEISRILKPGATLLVTVPWSARRHHVPRDYHRFTRERLNLLFSTNGFSKVIISERGNIYATISMKLIFLIVRNFKNLNFKNFLIRLPQIGLIIFITIPFLLISHLTIFKQYEINEDPLGYSVVAVK
jgi:SAM-dependent methyltransferase